VNSIENAIDLLSAILLASGVGFFVAGTVGLLRFPDVFTRLHALTKADNLGLGLICLGLALQAETLPAALKLLLIWLLALLASALSCHLIARYALQAERPFRKKRL
jgi:multicomponent Na+:H+ antiporter subunit G